MRVSCTLLTVIHPMNRSSLFLKVCGVQSLADISVWSFGTEDRPCERPVAPRNEEYDQVVFRGRDLEDVRLVQSSVFLNEDSAIVSAAPGVCSAC